MKTRTCAAVVLWCVVVAVPGIHAQQGRTVLTPGSDQNSCGSWVSNRRLAPPGEETKRQVTQAVYDESIQRAWVWGFVSGASFYGPRDLKVPGGASLDLWIDSYCQKSPLDTLTDAAAALVQELYDRATKKGGK